jgi:hypothetical protein
MLDCFQVHAPWQRRLWHVGLVTSLQEAHEASLAVRDRALGSESFGWYRNSLRGRVSRDAGVGDSKQTAALQKILRGEMIADSVDHRMLGLIVDDVRQRYLERWEQALARDNHGFGAERVARALAGHLLDAGHSQDALHRWLTWLLSAAEFGDGGAALGGHRGVGYERRSKAVRGLGLRSRVGRGGRRWRSGWRLLGRRFGGLGGRGRSGRLAGCV